MALSIRDPETDRLARELAALTGESMTEAIRKALAERLAPDTARTGRRAGPPDRQRTGDPRNAWHGCRSLR